MDMPTESFKAANQTHVGFGDVLIGRRPQIGYDGRIMDVRPCPQLVVGIYYDTDGKLAGFDTVKLVSTPHEIRERVNNLACLPMSVRDWATQDSHSRDNMIDTRSFMTIKAEDFDLGKGAVNSLPPRFMPDLIACRATALASGQNNYLNRLKSGEYDREGVWFKAPLLRDAPHLDTQPDVEEANPITPKPSSIPISESDVDAITAWSVDFLARATKNPKIVKFKHKKGQWPQWVDIPQGEGQPSLPASTLPTKKRADRAKLLAGLNPL